MDPRVERFARRAAEERARFLAQLADAKQVQERLLLEDCVRPNCDTAFGREHGLSSVRTLDDFRRAVPVRDYDGLAPYIDRAADGERGVLTAEDPIAFNRTSGTTGAAKRIPVTRTFHERYEVPRRFATWGAMLEIQPELLASTESTFSFLYDPKPAAHTTTSGGIPYLAVTARQASVGSAWEGMPGTLAPWSLVPADIVAEQDRSYYRMRLAIEHDVRAFLSVNPSTLVTFARSVAVSLPRLIEDVAAGTVLGRAVVPPNPKRAGQLEALASRYDPVRPFHLWPHVAVVACWTAASCALYLPRVKEAFGSGATILPAASVCSEGPITCPVDSRASAHPLAVGSVFFEFRPPDAGPGAETLLFHELHEGSTYEILLTHAAGLYRYAVGDLFSVAGRYLDVPRLEFVGRKGVFSSFTGEKLTETQVVASMAAALEATGLLPAHITCCPLWEEVPRYAFVVEEPGGWGSAEAARLAAELERQLGLRNDEYPGKRSSGRLGGARVDLVSPGTFDRYRARRVAAGASQVQFKHKVLHTERLAHGEILALSERRETATATD
jgi:hypothetical protein